MSVPFDNSGLSEKFNRAGTRYFTDKNGEIVAKECTKCRTVKGLDGFRIGRRGLGGRESYCRKCGAKKDKEYHRQNRDKIKKYRKEYYRLNRDKELKLVKCYQRENAHKRRLLRHRRRARKRNLPDSLTQGQKQAMLGRFNHACALTGDKDSDGGIHLDHVIPIASGHGGTTLGNMIPLRADLNISKYDRNIFEWFEQEKERFDLCSDKFAQAIEYLAEVNDMTTEEYREYVY